MKAVKAWAIMDGNTIRAIPADDDLIDDQGRVFLVVTTKQAADAYVSEYYAYKAVRVEIREVKPRRKR